MTAFGFSGAKLFRSDLKECLLAVDWGCRASFLRSLRSQTLGDAAVVRALALTKRTLCSACHEDSKIEGSNLKCGSLNWDGQPI